MDALERIYFTSPLAQIYVFSLAPELQGGTAFQFTKEELETIADLAKKYDGEFSTEQKDGAFYAALTLRGEVG